MRTVTRQATIRRIEDARLSAIIRTRDQRLAHDAMTAAVEGGFRVVEFTLTTPGALELITQFSQNEELLVGAGTVMTVEQARLAVGAGARFLVSPICDPLVLAAAQALEVVTIPGAYTPTEMETAVRAGADFVKVFPAHANGPDIVRAILGPLPHLKLFPTAGVTSENFTEFLDAGCAGVGFVASLFDPVDLASGQFDRIRRRSSDIHDSLARWRQERGNDVA